MSFAAIPLGSADDDLKDRRNRVERELGAAEVHLDQSSSRLLEATNALEAARLELSEARTQLAATRGELDAAEVLDSQMQAKLEEAVLTLRRTRAELAGAHTEVTHQEELLGEIAAQHYQAGDPSLLGLSMVLTTQDPTKLTSQLNSVNSVLDKESATLARHDSSRVLLTIKEDEVEAARVEVGKQRAAAAGNLAKKVALEAKARDAESRVQELAESRVQARREAAAARAEGLKELRGLKQERERISAMLEKRAEAARRRAEAAAARRAEAAAEAAAARRAEAAAVRRAEAAAVRRAEAAAEAAATRRAVAAAEAAATRRAEAAAEAAATRRAEAAADAAAARAREADSPAPPAPPPAAPAAPPVSGGALSYPVDGYITSPYGPRFHPVYKRTSLHDGTDFGAACGTPVRAAASGKVIAADYHSAYGNRIIMDNGYQRGVGLATTYNHLSDSSASVGERVTRGEIIGYVGTTGASTGCHLHFMVLENGATVDPMTWL